MDELGALLSVYVPRRPTVRRRLCCVAQADRLTQEPESIRREWREEQRKRLQELGEDRAEAVSWTGAPVSGLPAAVVVWDHHRVGWEALECLGLLSVGTG